MSATLQSSADDLAKFQQIFGEQRADFVTLDGWTSRSAWDQVWRAVEDGYLTQDAETSARNSDDQYTAACFRPTDKLRAEIEQSK